MTISEDPRPSFAAEATVSSKPWSCARSRAPMRSSRKRRRKTPSELAPRRCDVSGRGRPSQSASPALDSSTSTFTATTSSGPPPDRRPIRKALDTSWRSLAGLHWLSDDRSASRAAPGDAEGPIFRPDRRGGHLTDRPLSGKVITEIVKKRAAAAGLESAAFGGHALRRGFISEAGLEGVAERDTMAVSGHKSRTVFDGYYEPGNAL